MRRLTSTAIILMASILLVACTPQGSTTTATEKAETVATTRETNAAETTDTAMMTETYVLTCSTVDGTDGAWYRPAGDAYDFPLTPEKDPEKWAETDIQDRYHAYALPEDVLQSISTYGLVEACIQNAYSADVQNANEGGEYLMAEGTFTRINTGTELLEREDGASALVEFYRSINMSQAIADKEYLRIPYIEFVLSDERFISRMTDDERMSLLAAVRDSVRVRQDEFDIDQLYKGAAFLMGRLLREVSGSFGDYLDQHENVRSYLQEGYYDQWTEADAFANLIAEYEPYLDALFDAS